MPTRCRPNSAAWIAVSAVMVLLCGCTSTREYLQNHFKVGPDYCRPPAPVAEHWIDANDARLSDGNDDLSKWWTVFKDPVLNNLVANAYGQNLTVGQAGMRILESRAQYGIAVGELFPQAQNMTGAYTRMQNSIAGGGGVLSMDNWNVGFNMGWELDFWGRFRRAVAAADDQLNASVEYYDAALVTMLGDIAASYVQERVDEERIELLRSNAALQREILRIVEARFEAGRVSELDVDQAKATLAQTEAGIPSLEIDRRKALNHLCTLLAIPPQDIEARLGKGAIPTPPNHLAAGLPAQLLSRRPDVRRAERLAAAQSEEIGIAEADFYPAITINGNLGYSAPHLKQMFNSQAFNGSVGPSFQWNLLNYGRIVNNVRFQDAMFQELVMAYQQTVLSAAEEVENGLVTFLRSQERTKLLEETVLNSEKAVNVVIAQYKVGTVDFTRVAQIEQDLVTQQDALAQARGQIATGLISVYRALGGGWEIRQESEEELSADANNPARSPAPPAHPIPGLFDPPGAAPAPQGQMPANPPAPPAANPPAAKAGAPNGVTPRMVNAPMPVSMPSGAKPVQAGQTPQAADSRSDASRQPAGQVRKTDP